MLTNSIAVNLIADSLGLPVAQDYVLLRPGEEVVAWARRLRKPYVTVATVPGWMGNVRGRAYALKRRASASRFAEGTTAEAGRGRVRTEEELRRSVLGRAVLEVGEYRFRFGEWRRVVRRGYLPLWLFCVIRTVSLELREAAKYCE